MVNRAIRDCRPRLLLATALISLLSAPGTTAEPQRLTIGRPATAEDIARWDIDIGPDGTGLPAGGGSAATGKAVYDAKCASCHGTDGRRGRDKLAGDGKSKTIRTHWPYATTLFDYIRRAMPVTQPGSLTNAEVYSVTAYVLYLNEIVAIDDNLTDESLPLIRMPARDRFVADDRRGGPEIR